MSGREKKLDVAVVGNETEGGRMLEEREVEAMLESAPPTRGRGRENEIRMNSTYFGLLAEYGEANIPLERIAPKYFGMSYPEARRNALAKLLPCRAFRLGGQKAPWLVSAADLADVIDRQRAKAS